MMRSSLVVPFGFVAALAACRTSPAADAPGPSASPASAGVVADIDGAPVSAAELEEKAGSRLTRIRQEEYEIRRQVLDEIVYDRLLEKEVKKRGISKQDLVKDEVDNQVPDPDAKTVEKIYEQNQARFAGKPREAVLGEIRSALKNQGRQMRQVAFSRTLREKAAVKVALDPARATGPVPASAPTLGHARPGPRAGDDRPVRGLPVPLLPSRPEHDRRDHQQVPGQGPARPPRLPARRPPASDARGPGLAVRWRAGEVLGLPPEPDDSEG